MSTGYCQNQIAIASSDEFKDRLLNSVEFMQAMAAALETKGADKESVKYAKIFESLMGFTPVYFDDEDHAYIMVIDITQSVPKEPKFIRGKQICGALKKSDAGMFRCLNNPGQGTGVAIGRCRWHLRKGAAEKIVASLPKSGMGLDMRQYLDANIDRMKGETLGSLDNEVRIMEYMLYKSMESDNRELILVIPELIERIRKLKESRKKMEVESYAIDPKALQYMLKAIQSVTRDLIGEDMYAMWYEEIGNRVPVPTNKAMVAQIANTPAIEHKEDTDPDDDKPEAD